MTLRQVLDIIWQRWLLVAVTTVLVLGTAVAYVQLSPKLYESAAVLRFSIAASQLFDGGQGYGGIDLDLDPDFVTSLDVLQSATTVTGDTAGTLQAVTSVRLIEGVRTNRLRISSQADTPESSQARANAVARAYADHLQSQVDAAVAELETELKTAEQERAAAMRQASRNPDDPVAQQRLASALTAHSDLKQEIKEMKDSGPPAVLMQEALPGAPVGTSTLTLLAIGLVSGLLAGAGVALIREQFDDRLRSAAAIAEAIGQPALGEVALLRHRSRSDSSLPVAAPEPTPFNESIRTLRTSLRVLYPQPHAVVAVTSPEPGDGKTLLTANLAVSMARGGRTVVLVGGDLRRPRLNAYFGIAADREGFAEAVRFDASPDQLESLLVTTQFDGLRLLTAGLNRDEPADLFAGDTLPRVIERIRALADVVLIDTPPGLALADAAILGSQADGVVVIASINSTNSRDLLATLQTLEANGAEVAGVVANRSRFAVARAYAAYYNADSGAQADASTTEGGTATTDSASTSPIGVDMAETDAGETSTVGETDGVDGTRSATSPDTEEAEESQATEDLPRRASRRASR